MIKTWILISRILFNAPLSHVLYIHSDSPDYKWQNSVEKLCAEPESGQSLKLKVPIMSVTFILTRLTCIATFSPGKRVPLLFILNRHQSASFIRTCAKLHIFAFVVYLVRRMTKQS